MTFFMGDFNYVCMKNFDDPALSHLCPHAEGCYLQGADDGGLAFDWQKVCDPSDKSPQSYKCPSGYACVRGRPRRHAALSARGVVTAPRMQRGGSHFLKA